MHDRKTRIDAQRQAIRRNRGARVSGCACDIADSLLAINVHAPTPWRPGRVRLSTPTGYEPILGHAFQTVLERVPVGYEVVIHCGGNA